MPWGKFSMERRGDSSKTTEPVSELSSDWAPRTETHILKKWNLSGAFLLCLNIHPFSELLLSNSYARRGQPSNLMCNPIMRKCHCDFNITQVSLGLTDLRGHTGSCEHWPKLSWFLLRFPQRIPNAGKGHLFRQLLRVPRTLLWEQLWDAALHVITGQHYLIWTLQVTPCRKVQFCLGRAQQLSFSFE